MPELRTTAYRIAMTLTRMAIFEWDIREDVLRYDDALLHLLQRRVPQENISSHLRKAQLIHPKDRAEFRKQVEWLLSGKSQRSAPVLDFNMDFRVFTPPRNYLWVHMGYRVHFADGKAYYAEGFLQNVDMERKEQVRMKTMVEQDPMTGLYSKTHSAYLVQQAISVPMTLHALLVIDLDNFKQVNDKLGHLIGDTVILDMAMNLKMLFRETDILGHIGGDEFLVLMRDISTPEIVHKRCSQLRDLLRRSYDHEGDTVKVSASIGIALAPLHGTDYKTLFSHADAALYVGKRNGKDSHVVYSAAFDKLHEGKKDERETTDTSGTPSDFQELAERPKQYIMRKVIESRDTMLAVNILLGIFTKQFHVNRAYIFWHIDGPY